jgi:hypothetical protein
LSVAYIPYACQVSDYYLPFKRRFSQRRDIESLLGKEYQRNERSVRRACTRLNLRLFTLTDEMRGQEAVGLHMYWDYDEHLRPAGYRVVGESLYEWWSRPAPDAVPAQ